MNEISHPASFQVTADDVGKRLDQFVAVHLLDVSRARIQQMIDESKVLVDGQPAKRSLRLRGTENISITGYAQPKPLRAIAEDIPLDVVFEDDDLAVVNKPAGMMVHAGAGATDDERNRNTLVNALLHRFESLSEVSGDLRPGIVHRLDRQTSGLIIVAKNDRAHTRLAAQFSGRQVKKTYLTLVHGWLKQPTGTIKSAISRDAVRRSRMTTRRTGGRDAISHYRVLRTVESIYGKFSLLEVKIETGRTHQIRVHLSSIGHPVVGDTLYGAPRELTALSVRKAQINPGNLALPRNFLHAADVRFTHPSTGELLSFSTPLPPELESFLSNLEPKQTVSIKSKGHG